MVCAPGFSDQSGLSPRIDQAQKAARLSFLSRPVHTRIANDGMNFTLLPWSSTLAVAHHSIAPLFFARCPHCHGH